MTPLRLPLLPGGRLHRGDRADDLDVDRSAEDLEADGLDSPISIFDGADAFRSENERNRKD